MCVRLGCVEPKLPCQSPKTLFPFPPYLFIPPVPAPLHLSRALQKKVITAFRTLTSKVPRKA